MELLPGWEIVRHPKTGRRQLKQIGGYRKPGSELEALKVMIMKEQFYAWRAKQERIERRGPPG
jgi:hypothetical protein